MQTPASTGQTKPRRQAGSMARPGGRRMADHGALILAVLAFLFCLIGSAQAQNAARLLPSDVVMLAEGPHLDADAFQAAVAVRVPGFRIRQTRLPAGPEDPFLFVLSGEFGAPAPMRYGLPAGLVHCARYGLETLDLMRGRAMSDPVIFALGSALRAQTDDLGVWPPEALALLRCSFSWDDARRLSPWSEADTVAILDGAFAEIRRIDDASVARMTGTALTPQYGAEGFRLTGRDGQRESHYWIESIDVSRQLSHQRVSFRAFLLGAGM